VVWIGEGEGLVSVFVRFFEPRWVVCTVKGKLAFLIFHRLLWFFFSPFGSWWLTALVW